MKKNTPMTELWTKLPKEFLKYMNYCRSLNFDDKPCISDLKNLFKNLLNKKGMENNSKFDWLSINTKIPREIASDEENDEKVDYKEKLKLLFDK